MSAATLDPHWNTVPLLVMCQTDPFVDERHGYTVTEGGSGVTLDTGVKPFASVTGSAYFSGVSSQPTGNAGTQLRVGSTDDFTLGTGDFTIEAWAAYTTAPMPADIGVDEFVPYPIIERSNGTAGGSWALQLLVERVQAPPDPDYTKYHISFYAGDYHATNAMLQAIIGTAPYGVLPSGWHHYAVTRNGNEFTLWVDGIPYDREVSTVDIASPGGAGADIRI